MGQRIIKMNSGTFTELQSHSWVKRWVKQTFSVILYIIIKQMPSAITKAINIDSPQKLAFTFINITEMLRKKEAQIRNDCSEITDVMWAEYCDASSLQRPDSQVNTGTLHYQSQNDQKINTDID